MDRFVLASDNQGKLKELSAALTKFDTELVSQSEFNVKTADETAVTFVENALIKARHASAATDLPALADDSGLVVNALGGAPGIYSARYAATADKRPTDADNIAKLVKELTGCANRSAYFVCVLVLVKHADDPEPLIATGRWRGEILHQPSGENGFGYDPIFYCPVSKLSAAEMSADHKKQISHRARAIGELHRLLS